MGKGDTRRASLISKEEENLRWDYALGLISYDEYEKQYKKLEGQGKIWRK